MNLKQWAESQGIHCHTAYRWFHNGTPPVPATRVGPRTIIVNAEAPPPKTAAGFALYARVSSHDQRAGLDRQVASLSEWAAKAGVSVIRVEAEAEAGSAMNGARRKVRCMLSDPARVVHITRGGKALPRNRLHLDEAGITEAQWRPPGWHRGDRPAAARAHGECDQARRHPIPLRCLGPLCLPPPGVAGPGSTWRTSRLSQRTCLHRKETGISARRSPKLWT
ncbi:MAG: recombinase family protein [Acidimicrobiales bacterium]